MKKSFVLIFFIFLWVASMCSKESKNIKGSKDERGVKVEKTTYHGWNDSYKISNAEIKVVVVPAIGRIMFFGYKNGKNILWDNPEFYGKTLPAGKPYTENSQIVWANFGGDKVWPTEESDFPKINGRDWPPDHWFDGGTHTAEMLENGVKITSPVSDYCGARSIREIILKKVGTELTIYQTIEKVKKARKQSGEPINYTIWNITQVRSPSMALFNLNPNSSLANRYVFMKPNTAENFSVEGDIGVLIPDRSKKQKAGADSDYWLAAVVDDIVIGEFFRLQPGAKYPDNGLSAEIYTCPQYSEVELLSPMKRLAIGESIQFTITWRLYPLPADANTSAQKRTAAVEWLNSFAE